MIAAKPHKEYEEQIQMLLERGMEIGDQVRAIRKLSQVGYYRLSGFWYTSKIIVSSDDGYSYRSDKFLENTNFEDAYKLYLFDKKLRLLMMDALERIEIHIRSVIAHEVGRGSPLAYLNDNAINPRYLSSRQGELSSYGKWLRKQEQKISESRDECIAWHKQEDKEIPFWVAVETWDFGQMSKYYSMLKGNWQDKIIQRLGVDNRRVFEQWLVALNILRNRCAHHSRIWNRKHNPLPKLENEYFNTKNLNDNAKERIFMDILILWFLVKKIGPNSTWLKQVADHIDTKPVLPGCPYTSMGISSAGFPRHLFNDEFANGPVANDDKA
ncbi:Abi family protein [Rahnella sikkimica]|uniref:Abortive phage infection protein n=1 Tax=Rahnella sikkimica TaxID=1805933 RepID=A0A2L1UW52_9GAMM|nr:Abi family protein [Rahnella sikkimica]AVF37192.1 abortive phage infection protein [Rahnella sikkimica]